MVKNPPAVQETWVRSLGQEVPLAKAMATHSGILAWRIPWTEKPGRIQSMRSQRVRYDWTTNTLTFKISMLHYIVCIAAAAAKVASAVSDSVQPHSRQPTMLCRPWDSPGKSTGVGCHFLLQCMKVKSESEVGQSCLTLSDPMDCSMC